MRVMIAIFSDSVLGNIANDTANLSSAKYLIFGWLQSKNLKVLYNHFRGLFGPLPHPAKNHASDNEITH